jgi:hypothetical protein
MAIIHALLAAIFLSAGKLLNTASDGPPSGGQPATRVSSRVYGTASRLSSVSMTMPSPEARSCCSRPSAVVGLIGSATPPRALSAVAEILHEIPVAEHAVDEIRSAGVGVGMAAEDCVACVS